MTFATRRTLIRARNNFWLHLGRLLFIGIACWIFLDACGRLGVMLARMHQ